LITIFNQLKFDDIDIDIDIENYVFYAC